MDVSIVGISHHIQLNKPTCLGPDAENLEHDQKQRFWDWIRDRIVRDEIQAVAEESKHGELSIPEDVSRELGLRYLNIDMPPAWRRQRGIPPDYSTNAGSAPKQVETWHIERESFMHDQALQFSQGLDRLLIVCGSEHAYRLGERFRADGHSVVIDDLRDQPWYIEDWLKYLTS